jgi:hypothetical protein
MTPEEAWNGRKPSVDHFKVFGCIAYAHVPDEKRKKLDDKGEKCVFLGINEHLKAYKLFNPITKRIVISRDVVLRRIALGIGQNKVQTSSKYQYYLMKKKQKYVNNQTYNRNTSNTYKACNQTRNYNS